MKDKFVQENIGEMVVIRDTEKDEIISFNTFSRIQKDRYNNRVVEVTLKLEEGTSIIKQIAKFKSLKIDIGLDDKTLINNAKKSGYILLGHYTPLEGENISERGKAIGLNIIVLEINNE